MAVGGRGLENCKLSNPQRCCAVCVAMSWHGLSGRGRSHNFSWARPHARSSPHDKTHAKKLLKAALTSANFLDRLAAAVAFGLHSELCPHQSADMGNPHSILNPVALYKLSCPDILLKQCTCRHSAVHMPYFLIVLPWLQRPYPASAFVSCRWQ